MRELLAAILAALTAATCVCAAAESAAPGPFTVGLRTRWNTPPLLEEMLETLTVVAPSADIYFDALDMTTAWSLDSFPTPQALYEHFVEQLADKGMLSRSSLALFRLNLGLHTASPAIQAFYQFYSDSVAATAPDCSTFVEWAGQRICDCDQPLPKGLTMTAQQRILPFDHVYGGKLDGPVAVLYGKAGTPMFNRCHVALKRWSKETDNLYIHRWVPAKSSDQLDDNDRLYIGGYGVELALKSTEYTVTDDQRVGQVGKAKRKEKNSSMVHGYDFAALKQRFAEQASEIEKFHQHVLDAYPTVHKVATLTADDFKDFGFKVASAIMKSPVPLETMANLLKDFPKYAGYLAGQNVSAELTNELATNRLHVPPGSNLLFINGLSVDLERLDVFNLLRAVQLEAETVAAISKIGLSTDSAVRVLQDSLQPRPKSQAANDVYDLREPWEKEKRKKTNEDPVSPAVWWNDLQKDKRYQHWSLNMHAVLRAQGGLPELRKNLFVTMFMVDLSTPLGLGAVVDCMQMVKSMVPIRFGLVPMINGALSEQAAKAFYALLVSDGKKSAADFIEKLHSRSQPAITSDIIQETFAEIAQNPNVLESSDVAALLSSAKSTTRRFDLGVGTAQHGGLFVNGRFFDMGDSYRQSLNVAVSSIVRQVQPMVYYGQLTDKTDLNEFMLAGGTVQERRNAFIVDGDDQSLAVVDFMANNISVQDLAAVKSIGAARCTISVWVVADFVGYAQTRTLLKNALAFAADTDSSTIASKTCVTALHTAGPVEAFVQSDSELSTEVVDMIKMNSHQEKVIRAVTGGQATQTILIVVNGRKIPPVPLDYDGFTTDAFAKLVMAESKRAEETEASLASVGADVTPANIVFVTSLTMSLAAKHVKSRLFTFEAEPTSGEQVLHRSSLVRSLNGPHTTFTAGNVDMDAPVHLVAVLDPISTSAQKLSLMLQLISRRSEVFSVRVTLNPPYGEPVKELPIKRFYRFSLPHEPEFDSAGQIERINMQFDQLPVEPLLTLGVDSPQAWVVMPTLSVHDLDNIRLAAVDAETFTAGIRADLELRYILVEGHAQDLSLHMAPRGLQFNLGTATDSAQMDTIVMANLGYFQLKANPGVWDLQIRPGRSSEFYRLVGLEDGTAVVDGKLTAAVTKFEGALLFVQVRKESSKKNEELLSAELPENDKKGSGSVLDDWLPWRTSNGNKDVKPGKKINIFSVASGHLYERFLRIMIISVLRHTKSPVKFWFIENFLSPSFKDFIPHMAAKYGFEVELVTYKWPQWLRGQTEKQRTIWGYKILFLDVLFPLDLDRVIFVDADQIVRADLMELVDMDLKGAPYGYTPFCESRKEIEGFRFWKLGYWKNHLAGRPYHISALYVIDLRRFRQMAAGDRLRQQYQMLSADPNSLSNLDQDLPNDMQHQVPIFSLPQEWLWCETWCDDNSLKTAKTIDLCNNPMTKEPKLERAQRLLPEWKEYDAESRALFDAWRRGDQILSQPVVRVKDEL